MRSKLEAYEDHQRMRGEYDVLLLVRGIKVPTFKFDGHKHPSHALHEANRDFYQYYQMGQTMNPQYLETFKNKVLGIDSYGGSIGTDPGTDKEELVGVANLTDPDNQEAAESAKMKYLGVTMLCGAD